jgi:hypothetical protein
VSGQRRGPGFGGARSLATLGLALSCVAVQVGCAYMPGGLGGPAASAPAAHEVVAPLAFFDPALPPAPRVRRADFRGEPHSAVAGHIADWVVDSSDHGVLPFAIVDKRRARVHVFDGRGRLQGSAPALLGQARGDDSVPGIGERPIALIRPEERTTPAGRFIAELGRNMEGEDIVWVDYDAAVSMHRVRATKPAERRLQRLASTTPRDNRISYGCINLPASFYDEVLRPAFAGTGGIVYVLPETHPARAWFGAYDVDRRAAQYREGASAQSGIPARH